MAKKKEAEGKEDPAKLPLDEFSARAKKGELRGDPDSSYAPPPKGKPKYIQRY